MTRDGSVVDVSGVVTGGSSAGVEEQLVNQKRRAKELEESTGIPASVWAWGNARQIKTAIAKKYEEHQKHGR